MSRVASPESRMSKTLKASDSEPIRVMVADDHEAIREGLSKIFENDPSIDFVGHASDGVKAVELSAELNPDVILMDIKMKGKDGITATREIIRESPDATVIIFSMFAGEYIKSALEAGASGYLLKDSSGQEILDAIHQAHQGCYPLSPSLTKEMMDEYCHYLKNRRTKVLSERQTGILKLVAEGYNTKEIAAKMFISQSTAKREIKEIKKKLNVKDQAQAVSSAMNQRLIELS